MWTRGRASHDPGMSITGQTRPAGGSPGKRTLTEALPAAPVRAAGGGGGTSAVVVGSDAPVDAAAALALGMRGEERALPHRAALEAAAGVPLDRVRCFFGWPARLACAQVRAEAFTVGNVIVFASESPSIELVRHELAHVAQQGGHGTGALTAAPSQLAMTAPGDAHERAADADHPGAADGAAAPHVLARYFATNQQVVLYAGRDQTQPVNLLPLGTRVTKIYDPEGLEDGWVEVRVTHGNLLETSGFLLEAQITEYPDEATVDWPKAIQLCGELARGSFDTVDGRRLPIPFGYSAKSCQARAQAMAQLLTEKGYTSQKIFAIAERDVPPEHNQGALTGTSLLGEQTRWPFHVAVLLRVIFGHDEWLMVIDPALRQDRPMKIGEWMATIGAPHFRMVELGSVIQAIAHHDHQQRDVDPNHKTLLPPGQQPLWFRAPSEVYDFVTLQPQGNETGEYRFLGAGARDLERDHGVLQNKRDVIDAVQQRNVQQALLALGKLDRGERLRLLAANGFEGWLRQQFIGQQLQQVLTAFTA